MTLRVMVVVERSVHGLRSQKTELVNIHKGRHSSGSAFIKSSFIQVVVQIIHDLP